jgi:hypothetical protein
MELHQMGKKIGYGPSKDLQLVKRQLQRRYLLVQDFSEFALKAQKSATNLLGICIL